MREMISLEAVRAEDTSEARTIAPVFLEVIEEVPAGYVASKQLTTRSAIKIMTGAPIPLGADTVIRFEEITVDGPLPPGKIRNSNLYYLLLLFRLPEVNPSSWVYFPTAKRIPFRVFSKVWWRQI